MLSHDTQYTRLKVRGRTLLGSASYWLAADHLLIVELSSVVERYRRIALKDISVMTIRGTRLFQLYLVLGIVLLLLLAMLFVVIPSTQDPFNYGVVILGSLMGFIIVALLIHLVRGPTAYCELQTRVQTVRLPGITRRRSSEQLLALLAPVIRSLDGTSAHPSQPGKPTDSSPPQMS
jgi:hypothetical protein